MTSPNSYSHLTAKERDKPSFPAQWLLRNGYLKGDICDFGCGFGIDADFLTSKGLNVTKYDPHYFPNYPVRKFDTIICNYVLNVLFKDAQSKVLMDVAELLKPEGKAYFTVRRDLKKSGFRIHKVHKKPTYQCNVSLPYRSILLNDFTEIYEYEHFRKNDETKEGCPFCKRNDDRPIITESALCYAIEDKFPVTEGHALVILKKHISNYFELNEKEQLACLMIVNRVKEIQSKKYEVDDFNIGINIGQNAGQTIDHLHIHIIPRRKGDTVDPTGGVRNVIPGKGRYTS